MDNILTPTVFDLYKAEKLPTVEPRQETVKTTPVNPATGSYAVERTSTPSPVAPKGQVYWPTSASRKATKKATSFKRDGNTIEATKGRAKTTYAKVGEPERAVKVEHPTKRTKATVIGETPPPEPKAFRAWPHTFGSKPPAPETTKVTDISAKPVQSAADQKYMDDVNKWVDYWDEQNRGVGPQIETWGGKDQGNMTPTIMDLYKEVPSPTPTTPHTGVSTSPSTPAPRAPKVQGTVTGTKGSWSRKI